MEPAQPALVVTRDAPVATLTLTNPAKRNAMTPEMWQGLPGVLAELAEDPEVRVLVLTGAEGTFCSGADIAGLRESAGAQQVLSVAAEEALAAFPKPTIAAIRGHCVGGGCQLAAACDLRFAAHGTRFGVTPAKLGIVYAASSTRRLVDLVGPATAKYLLFSGELIETGHALRVGLIDEAQADADLDARVRSFARTLASRSQLTQAAAKEFADGRGDPEERQDHWRKEALATGETAEGIEAFLERRAPRFPWGR